MPGLRLSEKVNKPESVIPLLPFAGQTGGLGKLQTEI
jgi:hypothetical protein